VALWWGVVKLFTIPAYLLPGPVAVFARVVSDAPMLRRCWARCSRWPRPRAAPAASSWCR
jgi:ABC-type nitrate/sulfonate/bicarbonate transport system permease component